MWRAPSVLVAVVLVLLALGLVMLASTSGIRGGDRYHDPSHFLKRQACWLVVAVLAAVAAGGFIDYHWWRPLAWALGGLALAGLVLVFVPHVGCLVGGARRWIRLGPVRIGQPSELAKFAVVVMLAAWMAHSGRRAERFWKGFLPPLAVLGAFTVLILAEPDYGTAFLVALTGMAILFAGGARTFHLAGTGALGLSAFVLLVAHNEERLRRFLAFLYPDRYLNESYQLRQSINAFLLGGGWGVGLGQSVQKYDYLPEAHTDFILAIIGEELGFGATLLVVALFAVFFVCGMVISLRAPEPFGRLLGFGITAMITLQAALNVAVVTGCVPTKGIPLPFISAGGSNLVMALTGVGVLVNIARHAESAVADSHTRVFRDRLHTA